MYLEKGRDPKPNAQTTGSSFTFIAIYPNQAETPYI
jgi:hypothetical protein